jgi:hypothetical protein
MRRMLKRLTSIGKKLKHHVRGQSLVEFTLMFPVLLILFSGLIEFGFALNAYLDLVDTAREVSRRAADSDPRENDGESGWTDGKKAFYELVEGWGQEMVNEGIGQIRLNELTDDIVISVFTFEAGAVVSRYPLSFADSDRCAGGPNGGELGWRAFCHYPSKFTNAEIDALVTNIYAALGPPETGVVLVEVYYNYNMLMALPWITAFVDDPILLHAHAFAPNSQIRP